MPARFGNIKFNLMRAIELFQDMNHEDMDVAAPPSSRDFYKEHQVAERLNIFLGDLIEEGLFDDCDLREDSSSDEGSQLNEDEYEEELSGSSTPESEGFNYDGNSRSAPRSKESFTGRFKRYVQRILPGARRSNRASDEEENEGAGSEDELDTLPTESELYSGSSSRRSSSSGGSRRLAANRGRRSRQSNEEDEGEGENEDEGNPREVSTSGSQRSIRERSGSEPYDPRIVYAHDHRHKHNHPGSHHHHTHPSPHAHTYHSHVDEDVDEEDDSGSANDRNGGVVDDGEYDSHGLSGAYRADSDDDLDNLSRPTGPRRASNASNARRSRSRSRSRRTSRGSSRGSRK